MLRQFGLGHFARIGARGVENSAAGAIDGARVVSGERADVDGIFVRGHVGETLPPFADADHLAAHFRRAVHDRLDDGIQTGNVAAACQDANVIFRSHELLLLETEDLSGRGVPAFAT